MKKLLVGLMFLGLAIPGDAQEPCPEIEEVQLDEVIISPENMEYLKQVKENTSSKRVLALEERVARYNLENASVFTGQPRRYKLRFKQLDGFILATYDADGGILYTYEKFEDIAFPEQVQNSIYREYPDWNVVGNMYIVRYIRQGDVKKIYKIDLAKQDQQLRIKFDEEGNML